MIQEDIASDISCCNLYCSKIFCIQIYYKKIKKTLFVSYPTKDQHKELFSPSAVCIICFQISFLFQRFLPDNQTSKRKQGRNNKKKYFLNNSEKSYLFHLESAIKDALARCLGCLMVLLFPKDVAIRRALCTGLHALHVLLLLSISFFFFHFLFCCIFLSHSYFHVHFYLNFPSKGAFTPTFATSCATFPFHFIL